MRLDQLHYLFAKNDVKLSADQIARLDAASAIPMVKSHEQINGSAPRIAGGKPELLDLPVIGQVEEMKKTYEIRVVQLLGQVVLTTGD